MNRTSTLLGLVCIALLVACIVVYTRVSGLEQKRPYLSSDGKAIDLAIETFARENGDDRTTVLRSRFPVVIRFGNARCVSLQLKGEWIGSAKTYCYDMDYNRVTTVDTRTPEVVDTRPSSRGSLK